MQYPNSMYKSWTNLIEKAKKFPIISLYKGGLKRYGRALVGKCILHDDSSPSLALYEDTNSWYCFGCGEGGDVISFLMAIEDIDFKTAMEELSK